MNRPETTLFLLMSVDGKISTGDTDERDFDRDLPNVDGVREGLHQYYDLEKQTDLFSLNTGRVLAKIGINERDDKPKQSSVSFIVIDNEPHLTVQGIEYLSKWLLGVLIVTTNPVHPAIHIACSNVMTLFYPDTIDFPDVFRRLTTEHEIEKLTVQSGGSLNTHLVRAGLIDHLSIVVAPVLIGGTLTPTLMDGESLRTLDDLGRIVTLRLVTSSGLEHSYLHLVYNVIR